MIIISLVLALPAAAYVLEGPHVLDLMVKKLGNVDAVTASGKVEIHNWPRQGSSASFDQKIMIRLPGMTRKVVSDKNREVVRIRSNRQTVTVVDGRIIPSDVTVYDWYLDILSFRSRSMLQQRLIDRGIDISVSSLGRSEDRVGFVIGAQYPDRSVPQIWIDKETFLPMLWIDVKKQSDGGYTTMEAVYKTWQRSGKTWFPMAIEFYTKDNLVRTFSISDVEINPDTDASEFDIEQIKSTYPVSRQHNLFIEQPHPFEKNELVIESEDTVLDDPF